jgi:hypothetical protein
MGTAVAVRQEKRDLFQGRAEWVGASGGEGGTSPEGWNRDGFVFVSVVGTSREAEPEPEPEPQAFQLSDSE